MPGVEVTREEFQCLVAEGIPDDLPPEPLWDEGVNHAPPRPNQLTSDQRILAVQNALRYFPEKWHSVLAPEFARELKERGRIYMYRFRPSYRMYARPIDWYPGQCLEGRAMMLNIQNNLDELEVAQFPHELVTYGNNGTVFQNWAQYRLTMMYLSQLTQYHTLQVYSGHPLGLFPSSPDQPRTITTAGMVVPRHSTDQDYDDLSALGLTSYGQMTANGWFYIGPQGIVHGTTITILNAFRKYFGLNNLEDLKGRLFVSSGLGGMSGAQGKAAQILGIVSIIAEVNPRALNRRLEHGWIDKSTNDAGEAIRLIKEAMTAKMPLSLGYLGNIVTLLDALVSSDVKIDLISDQTSCHLPYSGGYHPHTLTLERADKMIADDPERFKELVDESIRVQVSLINSLVERGARFFDYGNSFLDQSRTSGADIEGDIDGFRYPSYVRDLMGPICFDYGFGPFRWVCLSGQLKDLKRTDAEAIIIFNDMLSRAPVEIRQQIEDNQRWIVEADFHKLVVGSQARILYSNREGRTLLALAFNDLVRRAEIGPIALGRDHHDVGGTDSPLRETANIADGSNRCADMAVHNFAASIRSGATWACLHNGGGVGWGKGINGGFGLILDGTDDTDRRIRMLMAIDVNNGLARRAWTGSNPGAEFSIKESMAADSRLQITLPHHSDPVFVGRAVEQAFN